MAEPYQLTVAEAAEQVRDRRLSPVALAKSLLGRIDALDPTLGAWVTIDRMERPPGASPWGVGGGERHF